jgi:hypothetical protein
MTEAKLRKIILWISKIAILVISAPATLGVVDQAYRGKVVQILGLDLLWLIKIAVLAMVEGAFLYFWQLVEDNKSLQTKEEQEQNTYILAAWSMYGVLLFVGILHGEGAASLVFRFAMGLLMYVATNDKLAAMRRKYQTEQASGKRKSRKVRQAEAKAEEEISLHLISANKGKQIAAIDSQENLMITVSEVSAKKRILLLNKVEIVDGEVIEIKSLPAGQPVTNTEEENTNQEEKKEETTTKPEQTEQEVIETDCYVITSQENGFLVSCKLCSYSVLKTNVPGKDTKLSAIRAASRHCGMHKEKEEPKQLPPSESVVIRTPTEEEFEKATQEVVEQFKDGLNYLAETPTTDPESRFQQQSGAGEF